MQAELRFNRKDGGVMVVRLPIIGRSEWKELRENLIHNEFVRLKHTILLNQLKYSITDENVSDPFGDRDLFRRETATYFKQTQTPVTEDTTKGDFCLCVETNMFGGTHKHLSKRAYGKR